MQRLTLKTSVTLLTFLMGVTVYQLWQFAKPVKRQQPSLPVTLTGEYLPIAVSICDLLNEPAKYKSKRLKIEGVLYTGVNDFLVYENCSNSEGVPIVSISFQGISGDFIGLLGYLDGKRGSQRMEVDVSVVGTIENGDPDDSKPYLHLVVEGVELLSPLRKFKLRGAG